MQHEKLLENSSLLKALSSREVQTYLNARHFRLLSYGKNSVIHMANEPCTKLEIILSGRVAVERIDESGGLMTIAEFFHDDLLGGNLLFSKSAFYPMSVVSKQPAIILEINKDLLFDLLCTNRNFLRMYLEYVSDHAFILGDKINRYVKKTIRGSLISFLDHEIKRQGTYHIQLYMTKKALADRIGIQRTSLSRELAKMKEDGLITYDAKSIKVLIK
ncbi:MAG: DNA-binding transcriptional dual regulator Crp [Smithella sp. PtaU1.Bin162]|nr:MAG: DNA-binding transcriptional dual regulator Crp [Smithella sp. PtaU1.Bin162]